MTPKDATWARRGCRRIVVITLLTVALTLPQGVGAGATPLLNWGEILPGLTPGVDTSSSNICKAGRAQCVESVLRTMSRDFHRLARDCDHNAIFQLGYLRTTEAYYESSMVPGFYTDVPWMHHYDAVFAEYYLSPQREWAQGRTSDVPPAWREAFAAADGHELSTAGNFLLGMNAHINRDLPFVLDDIGLTDAQGSSRKPDHERVNVFLNHVGDDLAPEMAARFDPSWTEAAQDNVLMGLTMQQVIQVWREQAWTNAWLMTYSPAPVADLVAQGIEAGSAQLAVLVRQATAIDPAQRDARNAYCAANWNSWAGGDGTFFDGEDEPPVIAPSIDLPNATAELEALAALGLHVDVSLTDGVRISLASGLLDGTSGLLDDVTGLETGGAIDGAVAAVSSTTGGLLGLLRR